MPENGEKSKIIWYLLAIIQTVFIAWSISISGSVAEAKVDIATLKANYGSISKQLDDIMRLLK